jgi:hypothetical protein
MINQKIAFAPFLTILAAAFLAQTTAAQVVPSGATYFPMIGITAGQTLQINVVAYPPDPCIAQLGFTRPGRAIPQRHCRTHIRMCDRGCGRRIFPS